MSPLMVIGLQQSGKLYDYIHLIGNSIRPDSIYCVTDDFRNSYVDFNKTPSSTTYGNETYYGQDFLLKTKSGRWSAEFAYILVRHFKALARLVILLTVEADVIVLRHLNVLRGAFVVAVADVVR